MFEALFDFLLALSYLHSNLFFVAQSYHRYIFFSSRDLETFWNRDLGTFFFSFFNNFKKIVAHHRYDELLFLYRDFRTVPKIPPRKVRSILFQIFYLLHLLTQVRYIHAHLTFRLLLLYIVLHLDILHLISLFPLEQI